jgi:hypothetical protein
MKRMTKQEKILIWHLLYSLRNCFDDNGTLEDEYYQNVILPDLTKEQKEMFDNLINGKLLS